MSDFEHQPAVLDDVTDLIIAEAATYRNPASYLINLEHHYDRHKWTDLLRTVADTVEPVDEVLGVDPEQPAATSFYRGGIVGLRVAETAQGTKFLSYVIGAIVNTDFAPGTDDHIARRTVAAQNILEMGEYGLRAPDPNIQLTEAIEDRLCPDLRVQSYLRSGFGFVLHITHEIMRIDAEMQRQADLQVFRNQIEHGQSLDWSDGLRELGL